MSRVITKTEYDNFRKFLEDATGIVLGETKHYLVGSRLNRLMEEYKLETFTDLMSCLGDNSQKGIREKVVNAMTTNETMWFRDTYPYELLTNSILPELNKRKNGNVLRIWSAASSTGQEPYSLSMSVQEYINSTLGAFPAGVEIVATDISTRVLEYAKAGIYDESEVIRGLSAERKQKFFKHRPDGTWEVKPDIKARVRFTQMNLQQSYSSLGKFDVVFCRNVLIYFSSELKSSILERIGAVLNPDGYLILGGSEAPNRYTGLYTMLRLPQGVAYQLSK